MDYRCTPPVILYTMVAGFSRPNGRVSHSCLGRKTMNKGFTKARLLHCYLLQHCVKYDANCFVILM